MSKKIAVLVALSAALIGALAGSLCAGSRADARTDTDHGRCVALVVRKPPAVRQQLLTGWEPRYIYRAWEDGTVEMLHKDVVREELRWLPVDRKKPKSASYGEPKPRHPTTQRGQLVH